MGGLFLLLIALMVASVASFGVMSPTISRVGRPTLEMIRHGNKVNRLGRPADQRKALIRGLTTEVIRHGRIRTTHVRARVLKREVDHMITLAKKGSLHHR